MAKGDCWYFILLITCLSWLVYLCMHLGLVGQNIRGWKVREVGSSLIIAGKHRGQLGTS